MTIAHTFQYKKPKTIARAVELLVETGKKGHVLAGGTDLVGWLRDELIEPSVLIDIKGIESFKELILKDNVLTIGSLITVSEIMKSAIVRTKFPLIFEMAGMLACTGIRNRATIVGNICSAVSCCDSGPVLLVYDAIIHAQGPSGSRNIPMTDWFVGARKTALQPGELVTGISVPLPSGKSAGCFVKQKRYKGEDLAQSNVAILAVEHEIYRVAFGSVAPSPVRALKIEALLMGKHLDPALIQSVCKLIPEETSPISDIRSSKEYRERMLVIMLRRGLQTVNSRLNDNGPEYGINVID
ncbi:xanthine dehydrogenase family protein subunit M [bacterium]|nr:xanthine dehydrogenase family protein subunit M [bacterium]